MGRLISQIPNEDSARLSRVLDAKYRVIGVDVDTLKAQDDHRKASEQADKQRDLQYARRAQHYDEQVMLQEQEAALARSTIARKDTDFRNATQLKPTRREWDLNRPDALLIDAPARLGDDDPRCGASSMQRFAGEDLTAGSRTAAQLTQCKDWWQQQALEKAASAEKEREEVARADALVQRADAAQAAARADEAEARRAANLAARAANAELAAQRAAAAAAEAKWDRMMSAHEIDSALGNSMLAEDPSQAASVDSAGRVRKDHWKGMNPTEKQSILDTQFKQVEEIKAKRRAEREREAQWARTALDTDQAMREQERAAADFRARQAAERLAFLQRQAAEKEARDAKLKETYANKIAPEFFTQFGTSHR